jgi:hypothetical protein
MKLSLFPTIVAALLLATSASTAADKSTPAQPGSQKTITQTQAKAIAKKAKKKAKTKAAKKKRTFITGSYIPQKVTKNGVIVSAGPSPVIVIDSETIRRTGASDIPDLFRRGGWTR